MPYCNYFFSSTIHFIAACRAATDIAQGNALWSHSSTAPPAQPVGLQQHRVQNGYVAALQAAGNGITRLSYGVAIRYICWSLSGSAEARSAATDTAHRIAVGFRYTAHQMQPVGLQHDSCADWVAALQAAGWGGRCHHTHRVAVGYICMSAPRSGLPTYILSIRSYYILLFIDKCSL